MSSMQELGYEKVEDVIEQDDTKFGTFEYLSRGEKIVGIKQLEVLAGKYYILKEKVPNR